MCVRACVCAKYNLVYRNYGRWKSQNDLCISLPELFSQSGNVRENVPMHNFSSQLVKSLKFNNSNDLSSLHVFPAGPYVKQGYSNFV